MLSSANWLGGRKTNPLGDIMPEGKRDEQDVLQQSAHDAIGNVTNDGVYDAKALGSKTGI